MATKQGDDQGEGRGGAADFKNDVADFIGTQGQWISLHSADPGTTGANAIAVARVQTTWGAAGPDGQKSKITGSKCTFQGVPAGAVTHFGVWDAAGNFTAGSPPVGGNYRYGSPLTPGATLNAVGNVDVTPSHTYDVT